MLEVQTKNALAIRAKIFTDALKEFILDPGVGEVRHPRK
jgi:hypothetical protein